MGPTGPQGPQGPAGFPTVTSSIVAKTWNSQTDNVFRQVPWLSITVPMANTGPVEITWNLAVPMNGAIVTHLVIDGVIIPSTTVVVGNTTYATSIGSYYTVLQAGSHTVALYYRTNMAFTFDPTADWQSCRLQALSFDQ
jgi:hypothetical protein